MPNLIVSFSNDDTVVLRLAVELCMLFGADGADFEVIATELTLRIEEWVDMQCRTSGATR